MTACRCTLHPRKPHTDPCRACANQHVRLARSGADRSSEAKTKARAGERQLRSEVSATRREDAPNAGPSYPRTTNGKRAASNGSAGSRVSPSRTSVTQLPVERASQPVVPLDGRTPRVPQVAGRRP